MGKNKEESPQDWYYDYSFYSIDYGDRRFSSGWTPHGINCIDAEYCRRIQNLGKPVLKLIKVDRVAHYKDGTYSDRYWDDYTELPLDEDFYSYDRVCFDYTGRPFVDLPIPENIDKWRGKYLDADGNPIYQKIRCITTEYTYTHPTYSAKHHGEDPEMLRDEIVKIPNLHPKIKENLLGNLDRMIISIQEFGISE